MGLDFIQNPKHLKKIKERQKAIDNIKLTELKRNAFLKDQIINHNRIDLLMREVLGYTDVMDFHLLMFYHNTYSYRKLENQKWHLLLAPRGSGKCLCESVKISLSNGDIKKIKDIKVGDKILSLNDKTLKQDVDKVVAKVKSGRKKVYTLKLKSGREITSTLDHRYRSFNEWKKLSDFEIGEKIAVPRNLKMGSDVFWDSIESIEYKGIKETYDLQTLKNHNFVAQNIYTHNSTVLTISKIILDILQNPNIRILIASKTDANAIAFLSEIKQKIQSKKFVQIFGDLVGRIWNDGAIVINTRTAAHKEETVTTVGYTGALASKHFDKIYADDLVDEENSKTEVQRLKLYTWFYKILDPTLEPDGEMNIIGTRYHPTDLYGSLIESVFTKKNSKGKVLKRYYIRIKALIKKKNLQNAEKLKEHQKLISFWPSKFSVKFLLKKKKDQGTIIFNSQYMNDVRAMKGKIFKVDWFNWARIENLKLKELMIFQGVDLAIKQKENADKFAHVTIGVDPKTFNIFVLNYYNRITHYTDQKKVIDEKHLKYDPIRVGIEANGYQEAILQDMKADKELSKVRAVPVFTETDKTMRAWKLSAYFERGQVFLLEGMHELQEHLLQMPDGRYKDLFDALDIAIRVAFKGKKKQRENEPDLI